MDMQSLDTPGTADPDADRLLEKGDRLRDARSWGEAAEAYGRHLRLRPDNWPIWVQYGHCLKEEGDPKGALLCYREAERLQPGDSDVHVQIGHALKLLGRQEEAFGEYARALTLDPGNGNARVELMALEASPVPAAAAGPAPVPAAQAARPAASAPLVFDASDLLDYARANRAPTGIQRVQLNIIEEALRGAGEASVTVAAFAAEEGAWKAVPAELFLRLATLSRTGTDPADPDWAEATGAVQALLRGAPALDPAPGSVLVNLGTSWWIPGYPRRVQEAKASHGLRYVPFLHDCIPLLVPEHCAAGLAEEFARWFAGLCLLADTVLANSDCTRDDFHRLQAALLPGQEIPCHVVPLDAAALGPQDVAPAPLPPALRGGRPFILFVGTVESRKNHLLVFHAWLTLVRRHGPEAVPDLVCVGKRGWLAEEALFLHARAPILQEKVHLLHDVPDTVLEALYRNCLFTLVNSFYEGWGLPVTESLAHGKVALVPDHSAFRQSGAGGAVFFAPNSEPDLVAQIWRLSADAAHRQALEARLAAEARLRSWAEIAAQVVREAATGPVLPPPLARLSLPLGATHPLGLLPGPEPSLAMAVAEAMREGPGWSPLEPWGSWAVPGESRLRLPLPMEAEGAALRVFLELAAPPEGGRFGLRAGREGAPIGIQQRFQARPDERLFAMLTVPAGAGGALVVEIEAAHGAGGAARVGVCSLMVCRADDHAARLDYLERRALAQLPAGG